MKNNLKNFKSNDKKHFRVAIFGSSRIETNDNIFKEVKNLAKKLGENGIDVLTGGGPGLMRAANEGHGIGVKKSGSLARSVGIGVDLPWNQKFNDSVEYK